MNKCETCRANKVCDHNRFGFETCGNYIPEWISVEDRLPEKINKYIVNILVQEIDEDKEDSNIVDMALYIPKNEIFEHFGWHFRYEFPDEQIATITHWMPMPEPPKGETR